MAFNKNKVMDSARKYVEKGQTDKAIKEYLRVVREDPKDVRVWLKIGDLYAKKGAKQEATETYLKVAKFYSEQGFYLKAVAVYKQILKLDPRLAEVNLKLAELYRQLGLLSDAMQHFEMVAAHFHREGKTKEALATVRQLVDLDPENIATRIKLAELYSKEEMTKEAVTEFSHACEYLRKNNRQDDFIKVAERLLWHDPSNLELNRELATLYLRRNDARRALQKLQVCFKADARDVETLALLAQAFQALDQKSKTVSVLKELARILDENKQRAQAEEVHRKILMYVPDEPDSLAYLGEKSATKAPPPPPVPITSSDISARAKTIGPNPTGSMPLINDADELEAVFDDPELDIGGEEDFIADMQFDDEGSYVSYEGSHAGEVHSDEIVKILTETDVYVKYGLHQKAIDHLRRVFDLDASNLEARERLKEILISQGREDEAITELTTLAETVAAHDPDRAEAYLREVLQLDASHRPTFDIARRFRLDITGGPDVEIIDEFSEPMELDVDDLGGGSVASVDDDIDFDDIDFGDSDLVVVPDVAEPGYEDSLAANEFELDFDEPSAPEVDVGDQSSSVTQQVSSDQVEEMVAIMEDDEDLDFDHSPPVAADEYSFGDADAFDAAPVDEFGADTAQPGLEPERVAKFAEPGASSFDAADAAAFDRAIGVARDAPSGPHRQEVVAPVARHLPFDRAAAKAFDSDPGVGDRDAHLVAALPIDDVAASDFDEPFAPRVLKPKIDDFAEAGATEYTPNVVPAMLIHGADVGPATVDEPRGLPGMGAFEIAAETLDGGYEMLGDDQVIDTRDEIAGTSLEDDLDEADFFVMQGLYAEARDILGVLLTRYPNHPLVMAKLQDVEAMELAAGDAGVVELDTPAPEIDLDAIESIEDLASLQGETIDSRVDEVGKPTVLLEKPVDDEDADTHYDLGLAYKEMGLFDEAIKAFEKVAALHDREVQCRLMIGLCHRERSKHSEAVHQFKSALHSSMVNDREKLNLYYEIGISYQTMDDPKEALYYFEMVVKKDSSFRDISTRIKTIQAGIGGNGATVSHAGRVRSKRPRPLRSPTPTVPHSPPQGEGAAAARRRALRRREARRRGGV